MRMIACHDDESDNREKNEETRRSLETGPESSCFEDNFCKHERKKDRPRCDTGLNGEPFQRTTNTVDVSPGKRKPRFPL